MTDLALATPNEVADEIWNRFKGWRTGRIGDAVDWLGDKLRERDDTPGCTACGIELGSATLDQIMERFKSDTKVVDAIQKLKGALKTEPQPDKAERDIGEFKQPWPPRRRLKE